MKKTILISSLFFSNLLMASEVNCFSHKDKQFHLAVGSERISDFSYTSFPTAKKMSRLFDAFSLEVLARSGSIFIENEYCQESETEIKCQINPNTIVNIYNIFGRVRISKNGLTGFIKYTKNLSKLSFELTNPLDEKMRDEMSFAPSECLIND